jgi:hypothetical protein
MGVRMLERDYQRELIPRIKDLSSTRKIDVLKNNSGYRQGIPDLSVFCGPFWGWLEVKPSKDAEQEPNQEYYINWANTVGAFGAFIYPENEKEVLCALVQAFGLSRPALIAPVT